jgi:hypothetical protein
MYLLARISYFRTFYVSYHALSLNPRTQYGRFITSVFRLFHKYVAMLLKRVQNFTDPDAGSMSRYFYRWLGRSTMLWLVEICFSLS